MADRVLVGPNLRLRAPTRADIPALAEVFARPEVMRWWPRETAETLAFKIDKPDQETWVLELEGQVIGWAELYEEVDPDYRHSGIDIAIIPGLHGRGYGAEAVTLLCRYLFEQRSHHRIVIDPNAANEAAIRAYEKVGFKKVGVMRNYEFDHTVGDWTDGMLMDLLPEDLAPPPH